MAIYNSRNIQMISYVYLIRRDKYWDFFRGYHTFVFFLSLPMRNTECVFLARILGHQNVHFLMCRWLSNFSQWKWCSWGKYHVCSCCFVKINSWNIPGVHRYPEYLIEWPKSWIVNLETLKIKRLGLWKTPVSCDVSRLTTCINCWESTFRYCWN